SAHTLSWADTLRPTCAPDRCAPTFPTSGTPSCSDPEGPMKVAYDREADTQTVTLREDAVAESDENKRGGFSTITRGHAGRRKRAGGLRGRVSSAHHGSVAEKELAAPVTHARDARTRVLRHRSVEGSWELWLREPPAALCGMVVGLWAADADSGYAC